MRLGAKLHRGKRKIVLIEYPVPEENPALKVAGILGRQLIAVMGKSQHLMNVWLEEKRFKLLEPDDPMRKP